MPWRMSRSTSNSAWKVPYQRFSLLRADGQAAFAALTRGWVRLPSSAEPPLHVVPGALVLHLAGEQIFGHPDLDAPPIEEEGRAVGQPAGLLHQVGDQDDRDLLRAVP